MEKKSKITIGKVANEESELPPSANVEFEMLDLDNESRLLLKEQISDLTNYRELRKQYAARVFLFLCTWSLLVFAIVLTRAFASSYFILSDIVLTTLIGGTTISVIGLVGFMMQGLFHSKRH